MKILGLNHVAPLHSHDQMRVWIGAWVAEVRQANWKRAADVIAHFPSAIQLNFNRFRFVSQEPRASLEVAVAYPQNIVLIVSADVNHHGL